MREEVQLNTARSRWFSGAERFSLSAIIAGALVALAIQLTLSLLGIGIGAATVDPRTETNALSGLGVGSAIWLVLTNIIAMFIGGCVAARLAGAAWPGTGMLHGVATWALASLVGAYFVTSVAGGVLSGATGVIGRVLSAGGQVAAAPGVSEEIRERLRERGIDIESIREQARDPQAQQRAAEQAREAGAQVAGGISKAALFGFTTLLLGLIAAALGGRTGTTRETRIVTVPSERVA